MDSKLRDFLDPLDREILERALDGALATLKEDQAQADFDSDLESNLRRELIEIARSNGVDDPETLRDLLLAALSD